MTIKSTVALGTQNSKRFTKTADRNIVTILQNKDKQNHRDTTLWHYRIDFSDIEDLNKPKKPHSTSQFSKLIFQNLLPSPFSIAFQNERSLKFAIFPTPPSPWFSSLSSRLHLYKLSDFQKSRTKHFLRNKEQRKKLGRGVSLFKGGGAVAVNV